MKSPRNRAAILMVTGTAGLASADALSKLAGQSMPVTELMFVRGLFSIVFLAVLGFAMGIRITARTLPDRTVFFRGCLDVLGTATFLVALPSMQLANATAIFMATPIIATVLAMLVLKETVGPARWAAVFIGFVGVLLIVQPGGSGFNPWSILILASALFTACRDLVTRRVDKQIPSLFLTLTTTVLVVVFSLAFGGLEDWRPLGLRDCAVLAASGVFLSMAFFVMTIAFREGEIGLISPLRYTALLFTSLLGYLVWGDVPGALAVCGMLLTIVAGVWVVRQSSIRVVPVKG